MPTAMRRGPFFITLIAVAAVFAGLVLWIVKDHPVIFWTDAYDRAAHRDQFVVWRWHPLLQVVIWSVARFSTDILALRCVLIGIAAVVIFIAGGLGSAIGGRSAGVLAACLLASNAIFMTLASLPYQETLFLLWVLGGHWCLLVSRRLPGYAFRGNDAASIGAAVLFNLAALTRYEAVLVVGLFMLEAAWIGRRERSLRRAVEGPLRIFLGWGGVPILLWSVFGPTEVFAHEAAIAEHLAPEYLLPLAQSFLGHLLRQAGVPLLLLGTLGAYIAWRGRNDEAQRSRWIGSRRLMALAAAQFALVLVVDPLPAYRRQYLVLVVLTPLAAIAATTITAQLKGRIGGRVGTGVAATLLLLLVGWSGFEGVTQSRASCRRYASPYRHRAWGAGLFLSTAEAGFVVMANETDRRSVVVASGLPLTATAPLVEVGAADTSATITQTRLDRFANTLIKRCQTERIYIVRTSPGQLDKLLELLLRLAEQNGLVTRRHRVEHEGHRAIVHEFSRP